METEPKTSSWVSYGVFIVNIFNQINCVISEAKIINIGKAPHSHVK